MVVPKLPAGHETVAELNIIHVAIMEGERFPTWKMSAFNPGGMEKENLVPVTTFIVGV